MKFNFLWLSLIFISSCTTVSDHSISQTTKPLQYMPKPYVELKHPEWSRNATIYEVNIRQYTPEGTFTAFEAHLPRLKDMGIDILWLMPIHPIGLKNRKGDLGSYYSVRDFYGINPEFGTATELKHLIASAHTLGMHVIIDWVANHSSWDNELVQSHPEWYVKSRSGHFQPTPWYDWDDIIEFDFDRPEFRAYMIEAMKFWLREYNLDGFRCDVAGFVPLDFWEEARPALDAVKPIFMLAEWESRDLHRRAFDMTYAWSLWNVMKAATTGKKGNDELIEYLAHDVNTFPADGYRMTFTDNHDKNSWEGNQISNFGNAALLCAVTCGVVNGMPLVYSGQEAGLARSLRFFDKDSIEWKAHPLATIYKTLFDLKHQNKALWNGHWGGVMERIKNDHEKQVISFVRSKDGYKVLAVLNYSNSPVEVELALPYDVGTYTEVFTGIETQLEAKSHLHLPAWGYKVFKMGK